MSFSEIDYKHQVVRIDIDGESIAQITSIIIPRFVELLQVPTQPAPVDEVLEILKTLDFPDKPLEAQPYFQVRVLLNSPEPGLRARIESALDVKPVRLVKIESSYSGNPNHKTDNILQSIDDLGRVQPEDIFKKLYRISKYGGEPSTELLAAFNELLLESSERKKP